MLALIYQSFYNDFRVCRIRLVVDQPVAVNGAVGGGIKIAVLQGDAGPHVVAEGSGVVYFTVGIPVAEEKDAFAVPQALQLDVNITIAVDRHVARPSQVPRDLAGMKTFRHSDARVFGSRLRKNQ